MLVTSQQVINNAFSEQEKVDASRILDTFIEIAETQYIIPRIGQALYDALDDYDDLRNKIINALCFYVKYISLPELSYSITNMGLMNNETDYSKAVSNDQRNVALQRTLKNAEVLMDDAMRMIIEGDYPEYTGKRCIIYGGIIL